MKRSTKEHIVTLPEMFVTGKMEEAIEYLKNSEGKKICEQFCANSYLNAIFNYYLQEFKELSIGLRMDIQIEGENLPFREMGQIIANGLENAGDVLRTLDEDVREASVQVKCSRNCLMIRIKNRCTNKQPEKKHPALRTGRKEKGCGLGLSGIQKIVEKQNGVMLCYSEDNNFVLDVLIKIRQPKVQSLR